MVLDGPTTFIQTNIPPKKYGEERVITKIIGVLVNMILELDSETYKKHVVFENGNKVIYVFLLRAIYGMLVSALLFDNKFHGDLEILDLISILTIHMFPTG